MILINLSRSVSAFHCMIETLLFWYFRDFRRQCRYCQSVGCVFGATYYLLTGIIALMKLLELVFLCFLIYVKKLFNFCLVIIVIGSLNGNVYNIWAVSWPNISQRYSTEKRRLLQKSTAWCDMFGWLCSWSCWYCDF